MQIQSIDDKIQSFLDKKFRFSKSFATRRTYLTALHKFQEFLRTKYNLDINQTLLRIDAKSLDSIEILDEFYTFLSNSRLRNMTIRVYIVVAKEFLNSQGSHIYNEDLKQRFRLPKKENVYEEGLTKEILVRVLHNSPAKLQTAILIACSSGLRIAEIVQLRLSDIDFSTNPTTIHVRKETTKTRESRFTCLSSEATTSLKDYLRRTLGWTEDYRNDGYIFMQKYRASNDEKEYDKGVVSAKVAFMEMLLRVIKSVPELGIKNENSRNNIHFHAFRAWFKTQITNAHQSDFAEALMGHTSIKLTYYRQNAKDRLKTYLEVEPALTISDFTKVEATMEDLKTELASVKIELEKQRQRIEIAEKYQKKA